MERRYGRARFLRDALALGVPVRQAFSRAALRRRRDLLMREHHPDRGGSDERAREINEIYARMIKWLDDRHKPRAQSARTDDEAAPVRSEDETPRSKFLRKATTAALGAVALAASSYLAARKARRR